MLLASDLRAFGKDVLGASENVRGEIRAIDARASEGGAFSSSDVDLRPLQQVLWDAKLAMRDLIDRSRVTPGDMVGQTVHEDGHMPMSAGTAALTGQGAILHLSVPEGTTALYMGDVGAFGDGERELLLGRDLEFVISRAVQDQNGQWRIFGEVIAT